MKIRNYLKKKNYLMQLLLTIAGFVCIPLIIMQLLMMEQSTQGYSRLNEENIHENLQESIDYFTRQLEKMSTTAIKVSQDVTIRKASKKNSSDYAVYEAALKIKEYNSDDWSVGVWFYESDSILFNEVRISPERLYEMIGGKDMQCKRAIKEFFEAEKYTRVASTAEYAEGGDAVIVAAKPISFVSVMEKDALVFLVMDQETVEQELYAKFYDCSGVALLDVDGRFMVRSDVFSAEMFENTGFQKFLENEEQTTYATITDEKARICIYKYKDVITGYTCLVSMFEDNLEAHLREYVTNIRTILITSIVLMLLLLALTVNINYRPIKRLAKKHGSKAASAELSELELLDSAFFAIDQKVLSQNKLLKHFIISDLLTGRPVDEKQLEESNLGKNSHGSVVMALDGPAITSIQSGKIIAAMKGKCGCDTYITEITYRPQILMVCVLYGDVEPEHLKDLAGELLKEITGHEYSIYCGNVVENITDIRNSYLKTLTNAGENDGNTPELNSAVAEAIQKFGESMYSGDADKIQKLLDVVESRLSTIEDSDALKNYYCYKLMTVYFANAKDSQNLKEEMARLIAFSDTRQLFVMLRQSVRRLCAVLNENEQTTANKMSKKLLNYVDVNFNNQNLCLTSAADYLETSIYVVSRLFKEATGKGFKEYVTDKRLEYARELLETTNYNVSEISAMAGFENTVYFSNVFKAKYGLPPTQYRKKHQE